MKKNTSVDRKESLKKKTSGPTGPIRQLSSLEDVVELKMEAEGLKTGALKGKLFAAAQESLEDATDDLLNDGKKGGSKKKKAFFQGCFLKIVSSSLWFY